MWSAFVAQERRLAIDRDFELLRIAVVGDNRPVIADANAGFDRIRWRIARWEAFRDRFVQIVFLLRFIASHIASSRTPRAPLLGLDVPLSPVEEIRHSSSIGRVIVFGRW